MKTQILWFIEKIDILGINGFSFNLQRDKIGTFFPVFISFFLIQKDQSKRH